MYPKDKCHDCQAYQADESEEQVADDCFEGVLPVHIAGVLFLFHGCRGNCDKYGKKDSPDRPDVKGCTFGPVQSGRIGRCRSHGVASKSIEWYKILQRSLAANRSEGREVGGIRAYVSDTYCEGVLPESFLNTWLKEDLELNPESSAMARML